MARTILRLLALVGAVVLLAGCHLVLDVRVDIGANGAGSVTVTATADAQLLAKIPGAVADLRLDDARAAGWTVTGPAKTADGGARLVLTKAFSTPEEATQILGEINGPRGPLRGLTVAQHREFAKLTTTMNGSLRLDGGVAAFADDALAKLAGQVPFAQQVAASGVPIDKGLSLVLTMSAPGSITTTNGTPSSEPGGAAVSWTPPLTAGRSTPVNATFVKSDAAATRARNLERWTTWGLVGWGALFALIVAIVVIVAAVRRRRRRYFF